MPAKNVVKQYLTNGYYHIYNRGVEKRPIFQDQQDYSVFISYLKNYLLPKDDAILLKNLADPRSTAQERDRIRKAMRMNNFSDEIVLIAYCLMPNHFHFLIKQKSAGAINKFMNSFSTRYTMFFNKKNKRVGPLYQDTYKAVLVESEEQLLHLSRYIHKQAQSNSSLSGSGQPSSYPIYLGTQDAPWVHPEIILPYFSQNNPRSSYKNFVNESEDIDYASSIYSLLLED